MFGTVERTRAQCGADIAESLARLGVGYPDGDVARTPANDDIVKNLHLARWAKGGEMMQILNDARNGAIAHIEGKRAEVRRVRASAAQRYPLCDPTV